MKAYYIDRETRAIADLSSSDDGWEIHRINVPTSERGHGIGSRLLARILEDADKEKATLWLLPMSSGGLSYHGLVSWYQRHGFVWMGEPNRSPLRRRSA